MNTDAIRTLHAKGLPDSEIAAKAGLAVSTIWRVRRRLRLARNPAPPAGRSFDEGAARRHHTAGLNDREIASRLGVSRETIQKWRRAQGLHANGWPHAGSRRAA